MLKKQICVRNKWSYISHNGHGTDWGGNTTYRTLDQTLHNASIENQRTISTHPRLGKRDAKQSYMKQIEDTRIACAICEELHFAKKINSFNPDLQK